MVAVAPLWLCARTSAAAGPAPASTPAAASPDVRTAAARRAAPLPRADGAEYAAHTEFPFEQDPLTWGPVPPAESSSSESHLGILKISRTTVYCQIVRLPIRIGIVIPS
ncbi:hypothetical protein ACE1SV_39060 [Streptomyces sennicomposti]